MIKALFIEDEKPAATRLQKLLGDVAPEIELITTLDSVSQAIEWFKTNPAPDLLILDIQLADGLSFDIFRKVKIDSFVIFTTAFDEYAIKAFELNSIDYLLKPVDALKLAHAIGKFKMISKKQSGFDINALIKTIEERKTNYKKRFIVNIGSKIKSIEITDIVCFYMLDKSIFLYTNDGKSLPIDFSLDKLETLLDPEQFFRVNRQQMINYCYIDKINILSKSRIRIETKPELQEEILVSSAKSHPFREWLDR
jgi:two-component system, LytTR family, response regulator LytT